MLFSKVKTIDDAASVYERESRLDLRTTTAARGQANKVLTLINGELLALKIEEKLMFCTS
jgi:hypothetical protein